MLTPATWKRGPRLGHWSEENKLGTFLFSSPVGEVHLFKRSAFTAYPLLRIDTLMLGANFLLYRCPFSVCS